MERRALLATVLSIIVVMIWQQLFFPPLPEPHPPDSPGTSPAVADASPAAASSPAVAAPASSGTSSTAAPDVLTAAPVPAIVHMEPRLTTSLADVIFTTDGGGPKSWKLSNPKYEVRDKVKGPLDLIWSLFSGKGASPTHPGHPVDLLDGNTTNAIRFRADASDSGIEPYHLVKISDARDAVMFERQRGNLSIIKHYQLKPDEFLVRLEVRLHNTGSSPLSISPSMAIPWYPAPADSSSTLTGHPMPGSFVDAKFELLKDGDFKDAAYSKSGALDWIASSDQYFLRAILPDVQSKGTVNVQKAADGTYLIAAHAEHTTLAPNETQTLAYQIFLGPKHSEVLKKYDRQLEKSLDFGMLGVFAEPLLWGLKKIYSVVGSYGISIVILTVIIKMLFYPLMVKQMESAQKMKDFQPQMNLLRDKYQNDKNRLNQEMMKFMQENGINPLGGCLPILLTMPIWFAMFQMLQSSIDLYHTPFLYLPDLSEKDPYGLTPFILGTTMLVQQRMTPPPPGMDPVQAKMMQYMPLIFAGVMFNFPSGLVIYSLINTVLTIAQQAMIARRSAARAKAKA